MKRESERFSTVQAKLVMIELIERGLRFDDLATSIGVPLATLRNERSRNYRSLQVRAAIELFFNKPLWTAPAQFAMRKRVISERGMDVAKMNLPELKKLAGELGVTASQSRDSLVAQLLAKLAVTPKTS